MASLPTPLAELLPVFVAPMAGGPSRPRLVEAAARAGSFAQLAGGYKTAEQVASEIAVVRAGGVEVFGVNLFVPGSLNGPSPLAVDPTAFERYRASLAGEADRYGIELPGLREDDDDWAAKVDLLLSDPVPVVSFTFGLPTAGLVQRMRAAGTLTLQTVTSAAEAREASALRVDAIALQGYGAGGHSGIFDGSRGPADVPLADLVRQVVATVPVPVFAAGGIADAHDVRALLDAGASAAVVGTAVLRTPESGASDAHKNALGDPLSTETVLTRAFSGRLARGIRNRFIEEHGADAPIGYPALHHLTRPIRTASAAAGDPSAVALWAGTGFRAATDRPVADVLRDLAP